MRRNTHKISKQRISHYLVNPDDIYLESFRLECCTLLHQIFNACRKLNSLFSPHSPSNEMVLYEKWACSSYALSHRTYICKCVCVRNTGAMSTFTVPLQSRNKQVYAMHKTKWKKAPQNKILYVRIYKENLSKNVVQMP